MITIIATVAIVITGVLALWSILSLGWSLYAFRVFKRVIDEPGTEDDAVARILRVHAELTANRWPRWLRG